MQKPQNMFQRLSIKWKIILIIFAVCVPSTLIGISAVSYHDILQTKKELSNNLQVTTDITSERLSASLAFQDNENAKKILSAFNLDSSIEKACVFDFEGQLFADYTKKSRQQESCKSMQKFNPNLEVFKSKIHEKNLKNLGTLIVYANFNRLSDIMNAQMLFVSSALLVILALVSFPLAHSIQKSISKPIKNLLETTQSVSTLPLNNGKPPNSTSDEIILVLETVKSMQHLIGSSLEDLEAKEAALINHKNSLDEIYSNINNKKQIYTDMSNDLLGSGEYKAAEHILGIQEILNFEALKLLETLYEIYENQAHILKSNYRAELTNKEFESVIRLSFENLANCKIPIMLSNSGTEWSINVYRHAFLKTIENINEYFKSLMYENLNYQITIHPVFASNTSFNFILECLDKRDKDTFNFDHSNAEKSYLKIKHFNNLNHPHSEGVKNYREENRIKIAIKI